MDLNSLKIQINKINNNDSNCLSFKVPQIEITISEDEKRKNEESNSLNGHPDGSHSVSGHPDSSTALNGPEVNQEINQGNQVTSEVIVHQGNSEVIIHQDINEVVIHQGNSEVIIHQQDDGQADVQLNQELEEIQTQETVEHQTQALHEQQKSQQQIQDSQIIVPQEQFNKPQAVEFQHTDDQHSDDQLKDEIKIIRERTEKELQNRHHQGIIKNLKKINEVIMEEGEQEEPDDEQKGAELSTTSMPIGSVSFDPSITKVSFKKSVSLNDGTNNTKRKSLKKSILQKQGNAVELRNVVFGYGKAAILNHVNVNVQQGEIYALLGSSGCGKTTLLRSILGRLKPRSGTVRVFGIEPNTNWSSIPGPGVGYMPQELSLTEEFSISETLMYFGQLYHMKKDLINQRIDFLVELLNLPNRSRQINQLSGGQKRRASIAATLFHQPPLLILDEPTVGVDPLLRLRIWQYLIELCKSETITVIITTHYIEEARSANSVAMMRFGRILAQENPEELMKQFNYSNLEDVFLKLCQNDTGNIKRRLSSVLPTDRKHLDAIEEIRRRHLKEQKHDGGSPDSLQENKSSSSRPQKHFDSQRIKALLYKNCITIIKKPFFMFLFLFLPVIQIMLICSAMGKKPHNVPITVFNPEYPSDLTDLYLEQLDTDMMTVKEANTLDSAINHVRQGKSWVAITFHENFSSAFQIRAETPQEVDDDIVQESNVKLYIDMSDSFIGVFIYRSLVESYQEFVKNFVSSLGYNTNSVTLPIKEEEIIYGVRSQDSFDQFIVPGNVIAIIYSTPLILASFLLVLERKSGLLERSFVSGVRPSEVIISHLIVMVVSLAFQVILLMIVTFVFFGVKNNGTVWDAFGLIFMQGFQGVVVGLLISSFAHDEVVALLTAFATVFPLFMISGVFWPMESMPSLVKTICSLAPLSIPINSFRFVVSRGWSVLYFQVFLGYIVSCVYISIMIVATLITFRVSSF